MPPPRLAAQCQSALSILTVLVNSDLLAMLPVQWIENPMLNEWLTTLPVREPLVAPPMMMVHRAGIGLTPACEYFTHLVLQNSGRHVEER